MQMCTIIQKQALNVTGCVTYVCQGKKAHLSCQYSHLHSPTMSHPKSPLPVLLSLKLIVHRSGLKKSLFASVNGRISKCWFQVLLVGLTNRSFVLSECGAGTDVLMVLLAVVGSILLVGVVLLAVWKLVITVHDWREFSRFQSARSRARYEMVKMDNSSLV